MWCMPCPALLSLTTLAWSSILCENVKNVRKMCAFVQNFFFILILKSSLLVQMARFSPPCFLSSHLHRRYIVIIPCACQTLIPPLSSNFSLSLILPVVRRLVVLRPISAYPTIDSVYTHTVLYVYVSRKKK